MLQPLGTGGRQHRHGKLKTLFMSLWLMPPPLPPLSLVIPIFRTLPILCVNDKQDKSYSYLTLTYTGHDSGHLSNFFSLSLSIFLPGRCFPPPRLAGICLAVCISSRHPLYQLLLRLSRQSFSRGSQGMTIILVIMPRL